MSTPAPRFTSCVNSPLAACAFSRSSMNFVRTAVHILWNSGHSGKPKPAAYVPKVEDRPSPFLPAIARANGSWNNASGRAVSSERSKAIIRAESFTKLSGDSARTSKHRSMSCLRCREILRPFAGVLPSSASPGATL